MASYSTIQDPVIPPQKKGVKSDTHYSVRVSNEQAARHLFQNARLNLLNVNGWHTLAGTGVVFQLADENGAEVNGLVQTGYYFRISIPGVPGTKAGEGDEWVKVEKIEEGTLEHHEFTAIRVRPAVPPFAGHAETAHFFSGEATSSFCVERKGSRVMASVLGRNEKPNTKTRYWFAWLRNVIVALAAMIGFNKPQWKRLVKGMIRKKGAMLRV